jgi:hypothetical protein
MYTALVNYIITGVIYIAIETNQSYILKTAGLTHQKNIGRLFHCPNRHFFRYQREYYKMHQINMDTSTR